ncbi:MAG: hypothetical protein QXV17_07980, partial [Candidatus Micrarchaeaceae archaeon]
SKRQIVQKLVLVQQQFFIYANGRLLEMPISLKWFAMRFYYRLRLNIYSICLSFFEQSNAVWLVDLILLILFTGLSVYFALNPLLFILLIAALFSFGEFLTFTQDVELRFFVISSLFLTVFGLDLVSKILYFNHLLGFFVLLFIILFFANLGFLVIAKQIVCFFVKILHGVRNGKRKKSLN